MIGHFLNTLTSEQEDRVLTRSMRPRGSSLATTACLVITAQYANEETFDLGGGLLAPAKQSHVGPFGVPGRYDDMCDRFGATRVNDLIRARILTNRLWRTLENRPVSVRAIVRETVVAGGTSGDLEPRP